MTFGSGALPLTHFSATHTPFATALHNGHDAVGNRRLQQPVLAQSISMMPSRAALTHSHRQGFGSSAEALIFKPTVWDHFANHLQGVFQGEKGLILGRPRQGFRWSKVDGKIGGLSIEDWISRVVTIVNVYIPQNIAAIRAKSHQMETFGRNVMTWLATFALFKLMKNDSFSFPKLVDNWFLSSEKKLFWGKVNAGLGFDYKDLLRAASNHLTGKGVDASKASFYRISKVQDLINELSAEYGEKLKAIDLSKPNPQTIQSLETELETFFNYRPHQFKALATKYGKEAVDPNGIVTFAKKVLERGPTFLKRLSFSKLAAMALTTVVFAVLIGDFVLRLNWLTFARLDKDFDPKSLEKRKNAKKGGPKPIVPPLAVFKALPSNLTHTPQTGGAN